MDSKIIEKNLLDLDYNMYLQYFNTCLIILSTYFIGLFTLLMTKQTQEYDLIIIISPVFAVLMFGLLIRLKNKLKQTKNKIKNLNTN